MEIKKILLTGGAGFIGSHLLELLLRQGYKIAVLDKSSAGTQRINHLMDKIKYYDIDRISLEDIFKNENFDCILHLATFYKKQHRGIDDVKRMIETNILFPTILLELSVKHSIKYFINTGTFFEYKFEGKKGLTEDCILGTYDLYSSTKISFENILKYYTKHHNIKGITLKLFAPYGEKDNKKLMVYLIRNLLKDKLVNLTNGEQRWNFTYVKDIASAYLKTLKYIITMKNNYDFFNIGTTKTIRIKDAVNVLEKVSSKKLSVKWGAIPYSENEIFYVNCDNKKAKNVLGWAPQYDFEEGLQRTYLYYFKKYKHGSL